MPRYKIWDKQSNLITPTGKELTPEEVFAEYPAASLPNMKYIVCDAPISMGVFMEFEATKEHYKHLGAPITDEEIDHFLCMSRYNNCRTIHIGTLEKAENL